MGDSVVQLPRTRRVEELESVIVRFAGDSGDGIQLTGTQFTQESALAGNDLATLPNYPAEIRAPAGTLAGVSGFQINFGHSEIFTPGDRPDVLVAMNPAALKSNLNDLRPGGIIILNEDAFHEKNLQKVGYTTNPATDEKLAEEYKVIVVPITKLTKTALSETGLTSREIERCKNFFALGVMLWMFQRPSKSTLQWIESKFSKTPDLAKANATALKAGMTYAEATDLFEVAYHVSPAALESGKYRNINGTMSLAYGLISAAQKSGRPLFFGAYPITPASDLLHELARHKRLGITTFQAEDEIAAICSAIGASYSGAIGVTSSSGPGIALKIEAMNLAVMTELPLVIIDVQRAGPSTGLPTKTEQADLLMALWGRPSESPVCVLAASSPASAFEIGYEACRIAMKYMTPVILLSDGFIANCSEPWKIPNPESLKDISAPLTTDHNNPGGAFLSYKRDSQTLARPWVAAGTPDLMHRIGGLEKQAVTGNVSYDPENHHQMVRTRAEKIERIQAEIPPLAIDGDPSGKLLVLGWGSTEGTLIQAVRSARAEGLQVSRAHLHFLNPLPKDLGAVLSRFEKVLIPEINLGQLSTLIRSRFLIDAIGLNLVRGLPLQVGEVLGEIRKLLSANAETRRRGNGH